MIFRIQKYSFTLFFLIVVFADFHVFGKTINILQFGANGNDLKSDHTAFQMAAKYIEKNNFEGVLLIPKGKYIVGKQYKNKDKDKGKYYKEENLFVLTGAKNIEVKGEAGTIIKYENGLRFGSFDPSNGKVHSSNDNFYNYDFVAQLGSCFQLINCTNIKISNILFDGNLNNTIIGGKWGDKGIQLWHYGIKISNSKKIQLLNLEVSNFCLDAVCIVNESTFKSEILMQNCNFNFNGRQALSWAGGNGLTAINCKFNNTGMGKLYSAPGAGLDIEAEGKNTCSNGNFISCEFVNNMGCGLVADSGPSNQMTFENCLFWGINAYSIWVQKPGYTFSNCKIYGSVVNGFITEKFSEATKFYSCTFEDKSYKNKPPFGGYLLEMEHRKLMVFESCKFNAYGKKLMWYNGIGISRDQKAIFKDCIVNVYNKNHADGDCFAVMRKMIFTNNVFNYYFPKSSRVYLNEDNNIFEGNNKFIYK